MVRVSAETSVSVHVMRPHTLTYSTLTHTCARSIYKYTHSSTVVDFMSASSMKAASPFLSLTFHFLSPSLSLSLFLSPLLSHSLLLLLTLYAILCLFSACGVGNPLLFCFVFSPSLNLCFHLLMREVSCRFGSFISCLLIFLSLSPCLLVPNTEPLTLPLSGSGISYASPRCWGVQGLVSPLFLSRSHSGSSTSTSSASPLVLSLPNGGIMFYFQLVIMAGTVLLAYYFEYTDTFPVHIQGFFCYDKTFSKPYPGLDDTSKIPPVLIYSLVTAIPTLTVRVLIIYSFLSMEVKLGRYGRGWVVKKLKR